MSLNTTWFFLIKTTQLTSYLISLKIPKTTLIRRQKKLMLFGEKTLNLLTEQLYKIYLTLKIKNKKMSIILSLYVKAGNLKIKKLSQEHGTLILDFSKKQAYITKISLNSNVLNTLSNGVFLKKLKNNNNNLSKKKFFLTKELLNFFFKKVLSIKQKHNLIVKGHSNDLHVVFQKFNKLYFLKMFINILFKFSEKYNFNKKKRVRSIKKRFKKSFLKNENKILQKIF